MLRGLSTILAAFALALSVTGCALPESALPPSQPPQELPTRAATYYNGYLGLAVTVPEGWYEEEVNPYNLTGSARESDNLYALDLYDYGDGGCAIDLITLQNALDSAMDGHAELMLYADYYPGVAEEEYLGWMSDYIVDKTDGEYFYELEDVNEKNLNGRIYTRFLAKISFSDGSKPYYEEYYITPVNGTFFVAYINYWSDSSRSKAAAYGALENAFSLDGSYGSYGSGSGPRNPIQSV